MRESRCVGPAVPGAAAPLAPGGPDRLESCLHGQRVHRSQKGGAGTGPNPTDRSKAGIRRHLLTDRRGIPLAFLLSGANMYDSGPFEGLLDAVPPIPGKAGRPHRRPDKLHADKADDRRRCRLACLQRGINTGSHAVASRAAKGRASTGGSLSAHSPGSTAFAAWPSATSAGRHPPCPYRARLLPHRPQRPPA